MNTEVTQYLNENPETAVLAIGKELDGAEFEATNYVYLNATELKDMSKNGLPDLGELKYPVDVKVYSNVPGWDGIVYNFAK